MCIRDRAKAREVGYANRFEAVRCDRPWRPALARQRGARLTGAPSVHGVHTAVVTDACLLYTSRCV